MTPINVYTKIKYEEKYRVYLNQYLINGWVPSVNSFEEFIKKVDSKSDYLSSKNV